MSNIIKSEGTRFVGLLHGQKGELTISKPFKRDIFLFDTHVVGTTHVKGIEELVLHLSIDDKLSFFREPNNNYDKKPL